GLYRRAVAGRRGCGRHRVRPPRSRRRPGRLRRCAGRLVHPGQAPRPELTDRRRRRGRMNREPASSSQGDGPDRGGPTPESYGWPLVAVVVAILPQFLVPVRARVGPPSVVPIVETVAFLIMLIIAAKPGPVPRRARPTILALFGALILANAAAA